MTNPEIFTVDGTKIGIQQIDAGHSRFVVSASPDRDSVVRRIAKARNISRIASDPNDFPSVLNELIAQGREDRWPKWPRWLSRRLHGSEPFRVSDQEPSTGPASSTGPD